MFQLTCSIVLYKDDPAELNATIQSVLQSDLHIKIYLVDNSPTNDLQFLGSNDNIEYIFNNKNLGYGKGQNVAIQKILNESKYHLILNPDITFEKGVLENIYQFMESNPEIGQLMPKVFYTNGELQKLCKLLPHPVDLIGRRFIGFGSKWMQERNTLYEINGFCYNKILNTPNLSGCFMFLRTSILEKVKGFDPRYFMYMEDYDLTRRIHRIAKTVFYPEVQVVHAFKKGSYNSTKLLRYHIISAIKYFNKWGWMHDAERDKWNDEVLAQVNEK